MNSDPAGGPDPGDLGPVCVTVLGGITVSTVALAVASIWLAWRDRLDQVREQAIGVHGMPAAVVAGVAAGAIGALLAAAAARWSPRWRQHERTAAGLFDRCSELGLAAMLFLQAIAEEVLMRLAVQDAWGLPGSVAVHALVYSSAVGLLVLVFVVPQALLLGLLMHHGFGLLSVTIANVLTAHLCLRRILSK
jgi:hypothetical protein